MSWRSGRMSGARVYQWGLSCVHYVLIGLVASGGWLGGCGSVPSQTVAEPAAPPLVAATLVGDVDAVRSQLAAGTDPDIVYNTNTPLIYAARDGFIEIARLLIDHGADVNWIDGEGVTPLILASFKDHIELVQLLLDHGADPTVRDQWNQTALDYALRRGDSDPIAQLLRSESLDRK
ncbi:MAG: ankyrin repeat domain-containing protein [Leptolyngbyaceae cyanobacterium]